jgi:Cu/Ag efflux protein CusF
MKKIFITSVALFSLLMANSVFAQDAEGKPGVLAIHAQKVQAIVESINPADRMVTLKRQDGATMTARIDDRAGNLDSVKVGDMVEFKILNSLVIAVGDKNAATPGNLTAENVQFSTVGGKPAKFTVKTVVSEVTVTKINYKKRLMTIKDSSGESKELKISEDVKRFNEIKKGDKIVIKYTEALAITVAKPS